MTVKPGCRQCCSLMTSLYPVFPLSANSTLDSDSTQNSDSDADLRKTVFISLAICYSCTGGRMYKNHPRLSRSQAPPPTTGTTIIKNTKSSNYVRLFSIYFQSYHTIYLYHFYRPRRGQASIGDTIGRNRTRLTPFSPTSNNTRCLFTGYAPPFSPQ